MGVLQRFRTVRPIYIGSVALALPRRAYFDFDGTTLTYKGEKYTGSGRNFSCVPSSLAKGLLNAGWIVPVKRREPRCPS